MGPRILGLLHAGEYRRKPGRAPCTDSPREPLRSELSMQAGAAIAQFWTR
jgi:hypothetical protein